MHFRLLKINILVIIIILSSTLVSSAQLIIKEGTSIPRFYFKLGYALSRIDTYNDIDNYADVANKKLTGPIYVKMDYNSDYDLTFGVIVSYYKFKSDYAQPSYCNCPSVTSYRYQSFGILYRMNYIARPDKKIQPYFGIAAGMEMVKEEGNTYKFIYNNSSNINSYQSFPVLVRRTAFTGEITGGINFIIKNDWGVYLEAGLARAIFQVGLIKTLRNNDHYNM